VNRLAIVEVPRRSFARLRTDRGTLVVTVAALAWLFVMALNVWRRHDRFDTFDQDLGFHTQFVWLLARGRTFSTILGLSPFAHNATFGYFLFVPVAWARLNIAQALDLTQAAVIVLGVVPVFRLARRRLGTDWVAAAVPLAYLLHPVTQGNVWETFHPEAIAMTPLLLAYDAADEGRWRRYWLFLALAIIWKTDVALFIAVLGLVVVRRRDREIGWETFVIGAVWFVATAGLLIPSLAGGATVFGPLYGDLGNTPADVITTSAHHPTRLVRHLRNGDVPRYTVELMTPFGFVPVLSPATLLVGLPQNAVSVLSNEEFTRDPIDNPHYQSLPVVALTLALIEGLGWLRRRRPAALQPTVALVTACALATSAAWGSLPFGVRSARYWSEDGDPLRAAKEHAVAMIGPDDAVSAQYRLVPHLAERDVVYTFPTPWKPEYYGVVGTPRADPTRVRWLLFDYSVPFSEADQAVADCVLRTGTFDVAFRHREIVVYERNDEPPVDVACG
jgi:uncharacterized membrane protein